MGTIVHETLERSLKEGNMKKKIIVFSFIAWAIVAISSPRPAQAYIFLTSELKCGTDLAPGQADGAISDDPKCDIKVAPIDEYVIVSLPLCPIFSGELIEFKWGFNYMQSMAIPGVGTVRVATTTLYKPGSKEAVLIDICQDGDDTIYVYGLGDCGC